MWGFGVRFNYDISETFRSIACGATHCLACTTDGHLYTWGNGDFGKLGTGLPGKIQECLIANY